MRQSRIGNFEVKEVANGFIVMPAQGHRGHCVTDEEVYVFSSEVDLATFLQSIYSEKKYGSHVDLLSR